MIDCHTSTDQTITKFFSSYTTKGKTLIVPFFKDAGNILQFSSQHKAINCFADSSPKLKLVPKEGIPLIWWSQTVLLWFERSSDTLSDISTADSLWALFLSFIWLQPQGALGLHRSVAMDVRQTCAGWKKISPEALLSRLHICALCGRRAGTSQPVNENMQSWETYWQTRSKREEKSYVLENSKAVCLTACRQLSLYPFYFFPPQSPSYLLAGTWLKRQLSGSFKDEMIEMWWYISLKKKRKL